MQGSHSPVPCQLAHGYLILNLSNFSNPIKTKQAISPISWDVYWPTSFHFRCISFSSILFFFIFYYRHGWRHISYLWISSWSLNISIITRPHQDWSPPPHGCQMGMSMLRQLWFILILCQSWKGYLVGQRCQWVIALGQHQLLTIFVICLCHLTAQATAPWFTPNLTSTMLRRGLREIPPMLLQEASNDGPWYLRTTLDMHTWRPFFEYKGLKPKQLIIPLDPVDKLLFRAPLDLDFLHLQVWDIYASEFKQRHAGQQRMEGMGQNDVIRCLGLRYVFVLFLYLLTINILSIMPMQANNGQQRPTHANNDNHHHHHQQQQWPTKTNTC